MGLDLELLIQPLRAAPEGPRSEGPGASRLRLSPGPNPAAPDPAL